MRESLKNTLSDLSHQGISLGEGKPRPSLARVGGIYQTSQLAYQNWAWQLARLETTEWMIFHQLSPGGNLTTYCVYTGCVVRDIIAWKGHESCELWGGRGTIVHYLAKRMHGFPINYFYIWLNLLSFSVLRETSQKTGKILKGRAKKTKKNYFNMGIWKNKNF